MGNFIPGCSLLDRPGGGGVERRGLILGLSTAEGWWLFKSWTVSSESSASGGTNGRGWGGEGGGERKGREGEGEGWEEMEGKRYV